MRYRRMFAAACVLCGTALWASASPGADVIIGSALAVRGEVFRADAAKQYPLEAKAPVYLGDTIVTGAGKAKISLNDGTVLSIGENTRLRLSTYQSVSNGFATHFHVWAGVLRLLVARIAAGGRFEIESETAIAAVRGTDWMMDVTPDQTAVAVISGVVEVSGRKSAVGFRSLFPGVVPPEPAVPSEPAPPHFHGLAVPPEPAAPQAQGQPLPPVMLDAPGQGTEVARDRHPTMPHAWGAQRFATTLERASFE